MDLTEAEDIKKRWQEYTEEVYKKDLHDPDYHDGVITHLELDILECEVKWALGKYQQAPSEDEMYQNAWSSALWIHQYRDLGSLDLRWLLSSSHIGPTHVIISWMINK